MGCIFLRFIFDGECLLPHSHPVALSCMAGGYEACKMMMFGAVNHDGKIMEAAV